MPLSDIIRFIFIDPLGTNRTICHSIRIFAHCFSNDQDYKKMIFYGLQNILFYKIIKILHISIHFEQRSLFQIQAITFVSDKSGRV